CCDGVWDSSGKTDRGKFVQTNVEKLYNLLEENRGDLRPQVKAYFEGAVTYNVLERFIGGVSSKGLDKIIKDAYSFLCLNYNPGDEIYLFGFSRGAYIARSIAGMVRCCGILKPGNEVGVDKVYQLYRDRASSTNPDSTQMKSFREKYSYEARIKF